MANTKKPTKKDKFSALLSLLEDFGEETEVVEGITIGDLNEFVAHELELLANKNAAKSEKKPTEKQKQNAEIGAKVLEYLRECGERKTITMLLKEVDGLPEDMTNQRMTHIVTGMIDKTIEKVVEKRVSYFKAI